MSVVHAPLRALRQVLMGVALVCSAPACGEDPERTLKLGLLLRTCAALEMHRLETGRYPETLEQLTGEGDTELLRDRWGRPYRYRRFDDNFFLISYGADGAPGGADADEDLVGTSGGCPALPSSG